MRNFFMALPEEIEESCMIDGAGRWRIFLTIVLPLSTPILATVALWLAVGHWNAWFDVLLYITDERKFVLQIVLRRIIITGTQQMMDLTTAGDDVCGGNAFKPRGAESRVDICGDHSHTVAFIPLSRGIL